MILNHLNLYVSDVAANRAFFETHFGLRCVAERGEVLAVMVDDSGFVLTLNHFKKGAEIVYPDDYNKFHVGFMQESAARVDEIHASLKASGLDVEAPRNFHGAWTFYFKAPAGFYVEVSHQYSMEEGAGARQGQAPADADLGHQVVR